MASTIGTDIVEGKNRIGGELLDASSGETIDVINPANGRLIGRFPASTPDDVDRAVQAAKRAYETWRLVPAPRRGEILYRAAEILMRRKEELAREMTTEMGKVLDEARGDVQEAIDMTYYMAGEGRRLMGQTVPAEMPDKFAMSIRQPIGVVGLITPWNFPIAIPSWKMMPALVAGNTVVHKPAEDTPILSLRLAEVLEEAGLPAGVLNLVFGEGPSAGQPLVEHDDVGVISFTGSREVGGIVGGIAGQRLKACALELGGKNAVIVLADGDIDLAVEGILWSAFGTSGQRCTAASRVIADRRIIDELTSKLVEKARGMRLGDGLDPATDVGPVISRVALEGIASYIPVAREEGAEVLVGGNIADEGPLGEGFFFEPTFLGGVKATSRVAREEIFGPVCSIIECDGLEDAVRISNDIEYGLSSAIFTRDVNSAFRAIRDLFTGITYINAGTTGAEIQLPFGGTRHTGNGHREAGTAALDTYTEWKSVYVDFSGKLQRAQID
jgi:aldehyde dehydrogenase (NAD+)